MQRHTDRALEENAARAAAGALEWSGLHPSEQRYEHVRRDANHAVVRYVGRHRDFVGDLVFDRNGVVDLYPDLARRVTGP